MLSEIAEVEFGFAFDAALFNTEGRGLPLIRIRDVLARESETYYAGEFESRYLVNAGDYLIGMDGQFNLARWRGGAALLNQRVCKLGSLDASVDRSYLAHYLPIALKEIEERTSFVTVKHLSARELRAIHVPLPPLDQQRRIATILDQADALRAKRRQVLAHLDALTQSIFHDMFGRSRFRTRRFDDVVLELEGGRSLVADDSAAVSEYRVLKISAVTTNRFLPGESKPLPAGYVPPPHHLVRLGDLLFSRANTADLVGAVALVDQDVEGLALPDKLWRFVWREPADVEPLYIWMLLQSPEMRHELSSRASGTGGSMKNISKAKLGGLGLPWPSMELQREFAARIRVVNDQSAEMHGLARHSDELFASLEFRAFRGEL
jgi:type I restriction enzyme S subunit